MLQAQTIHSEHAAATAAVRPLQALTERTARVQNKSAAVLVFVGPQMWLKVCTAHLRCIWVQSGAVVHTVDSEHIFLKRTGLASCKYAVCLVAFL